MTCIYGAMQNNLPREFLEVGRYLPPPLGQQREDFLLGHLSVNVFNVQTHDENTL